MAVIPVKAGIQKSSRYREPLSSCTSLELFGNRLSNVEILAIIPKSKAAEWLVEAGEEK